METSKQCNREVGKWVPREVEAWLLDESAWGRASTLLFTLDERRDSAGFYPKPGYSEPMVTQPSKNHAKTRVSPLNSFNPPPMTPKASI